MGAQAPTSCQVTSPRTDATPAFSAIVHCTDGLPVRLIVTISSVGTAFGTYNSPSPNTDTCEYTSALPVGNYTAAFASQTTASSASAPSVPFSIVNLVTKDLQLKYDVKQSTFKNLQIIYDVIQKTTIEKNLQIIFDTGGFVNKDLQLIYDTKIGPITKDLELIWYVHLGWTDYDDEDINTIWEVLTPPIYAGDV